MILLDLPPEVRDVRSDMQEVVLRDALDGQVRNLRGRATERMVHNVPEGQCGLPRRLFGASLRDVPQDLDFVNGLIFILVHIAPQGNLHLVLEGRVLWEDPPLVAPMYHLIQRGPRGGQGAHIACWRGDARLDDAEREVQMGPGEGPIQGLVGVDRRQEGHALRKPPIPVQEALLGLRGPALNADPGLRAGPVEPLGREAPEDPKVNVGYIRDRPVAVLRRHEEETRVQLCRLGVDAGLEGHLDLLGEFHRAPRVNIGPERRSPVLLRGRRGHREGGRLRR